MTTFIDWLEEDKKQSLVAWMVLEMMSQQGIDKFGKFDSSNIRVDMKINDIPVDFKECVCFIESQIDDYKDEVRNECYDEIIDDVSFEISNLLDKIKKGD